jgi:hypothetical protein
MIKGKYKVVETIKQNDYKAVHRCLRNDGHLFILKSYSLTEGRLAQNEVQTYQKMKQPTLHGFPELK